MNRNQLFFFIYFNSKTNNSKNSKKIQKNKVNWFIDGIPTALSSLWNLIIIE